MSEHPERRAARERMTAAGVTYADVKAWAVASHRWTEQEVTVLNLDAVEAFFVTRDAGAADRFAALMADPGFWRELLAEAEEFGPLAPEEWRAPLALLVEGARGFLALVDAP